MNRDQVLAELTSVAREVFDDENVALADQTTAKDVPQWTSLTHITLIFAVEQRFGVSFKTAEIARLANVGQLVDAIMRKRADSHGV